MLTEENLWVYSTWDESSLDLGDAELVSSDMLALVKCLNLNPIVTTLRLAHNSIGDEGAKVLGKLKYISRLDLSFNNVTEGGLSELVTNAPFQWLCLDVNNIHDEGIDWLIANKTDNMTISANFNPANKEKCAKLNPDSGTRGFGTRPFTS